MAGDAARETRTSNGEVPGQASTGVGVEHDLVPGLACLLAYRDALGQKGEIAPLLLPATGATLLSTPECDPLLWGVDQPFNAPANGVEAKDAFGGVGLTEWRIGGLGLPSANTKFPMGPSIAFAVGDDTDGKLVLRDGPTVGPAPTRTVVLREVGTRTAVAVETPTPSQSTGA